MLVTALACVRGKLSVKPHQMGSEPCYQRREASDEAQPLEQNGSGAIAKRVLHLVDHQAIAVSIQTLTRDGRAREISAQGHRPRIF